MPAINARRASVGIGSHLDSQTVVTGGSGTAPLQNRLRGYSSGGFGSINDGTSNLYSGAAITAIYWSENGGSPFYALAIPGAANSGWDTLTIGGTVLTRTAATYASGTWTWNTTDILSAQGFGSLGTAKFITFD